MRVVTRAWLLLGTLTLVPVLVFAQAQTTGRVTGTVIDEEGNPVAGARVTFMSPSLQGERVLPTATSGRFLAAVLPVGPYSVEVVAPGMQPFSVSFRLGLGETVPLNIVLKRGEQVVERVTVYSTAAALETTTLGTNVDYPEQVDELPIIDRNFTAITAVYAPNVGRAWAEPDSGPSIAGARGYDNVVLLDAAEISDPYFGREGDWFIYDAVEEVQVMTGGVGARYGRFQGGVINDVTKTGGNTFGGTVRLELTNESWNSKTPYSGEEQSDELNQVYQATLGGYILKDHLWFFGAVWTTPDSEQTGTTLVTGDNFTRTAEDQRWQLKLRGAVTPDHVVDAFYFDRDASGRGGGLYPGNLEAADSRVSATRFSTAGLGYQGVLTPNLFLDFQTTQKSNEFASGGDPEGFDPLYDIVRGAILNNAWYDPRDVDVRDSETFGLNITQVLSTANWGSHALEYGVQYVDSITSGENKQSPTPFNLLSYAFDPSTPTWVTTRPDGLEVFNVLNLYAGGGQLNYRWSALPLGGEQSVENLAIYVQDTWEVGKWRFDAGLRWETYDGNGPKQTDQFDFNEIAPRVGVTYNIDQNWQVQATYGKYVARFNDAVFSNTAGVKVAPRNEQFYAGDHCWADPALNTGNTLSDGVTPIDPGLDGCDAHDIAAILRDEGSWGALTSVVDPRQPVEFLADGIEAPYANDFNFSVRRALPRNSGSLVFAYVRREFSDLTDDFAGAVCDDFPYTYLGGECSNTTDINDPDGSLVTTLDTVIWGNTDRIARDYDAFTLVADWTPGARWGVGGNYTFARTQGNYEDRLPNWGSAIGDWERGRPDEAAVPFGVLDADITHRLLAWGNYRFNFDRAGALVLGSIFRYQTGQTWNKTAKVPRALVAEYANQPFTYQHFFDGRGNDRFDDWWALDLSARYQLPIFKRLGGWVKVTALNVLNNDTLIAYETTGRANLDGVFPRWEPVGNCGPGDPPSESCTGFGRILNEDYYQRPRNWLLTIGLQF